MKKAGWKTALNWGLVLIVLYFFAENFYQNWTKITRYDWDLNVAELAASVVIHILAFLLFSIVWRWLIAAYGRRVSVTAAFKISYLANLGRYIPGKIWPVFGMAYLAEQAGVNKRESVSSWIIALVYANLASLLIVVLSLPFNESTVHWLQSTIPNAVLIIGALCAAIAYFVALFNPRVVTRVVNLLLRSLKRDEVQLSISRVVAAKMFFGYMACWIVFGFAFWVFTNSLLPQGSVPMYVGVGSFVIAYQCGYLAFFAPGGIGVRELMIVLTLEPYVGDVAYAIALTARVWNMVVEALAALIAYKLKIKRP